MPNSPETEALEEKLEKAGFLVRKYQAGESFMIGPDIEIHINRIQGSRALIAIKAPKDKKITLNVKNRKA